VPTQNVSPPLRFQYDRALYDIHNRSDICSLSCVPTPYVSLRVLYAQYEGYVRNCAHP
jgi:hypothetical protein